MYEIYLGNSKDSYYVVVQGNKIYFDTEPQAMKFIIELLKETGRIGY